MALPSLKPIRVGDPIIDRAASEIYKDINKIIKAVNSSSQSADTSEGKLGDTRVNTKGFEYHTGNKWVSIDMNWIRYQLLAKLSIVEVPSSATSKGISGQVAYNATHLYICVAENTWRRVALATW